MTTNRLKLTIRDFPADFADRFPDGDYTVGRGADPRGRAEPGLAQPAETVSKKKPKVARGKRVTRTAAE